MEGGFFEEGSSVILGNNVRLAKVMGVVGVGDGFEGFRKGSRG
jgi:hypothetical protein